MTFPKPHREYMEGQTFGIISVCLLSLGSFYRTMSIRKHTCFLWELEPIKVALNPLLHTAQTSSESPDQNRGCPQVITGLFQSTDILINPHHVCGFVFFFKKIEFVVDILEIRKIHTHFFLDFWFLLQSQTDLSTCVAVHSCEAKISILSPIHHFERHTLPQPSLSGPQLHGVWVCDCADLT